MKKNSLIYRTVHWWICLRKTPFFKWGNFFLFILIFNLSGILSFGNDGDRLQETKVTGIVTDESGNVLPGVSVIVKGTTLGSLTDASGVYTISNTPANSVLVFSFIGMTTQEIPVSGRTQINVTLKAETIGLDEVVVTAFGIKRAQKALAYAVQEVGGEGFVEARVPNVANALSGKIAGVDATQANAGIGGSSRVIIRGNTSLNGNQQPLYVVDGMPIINVNRTGGTSTTGLNVDRGDGISMMNQDDIESISVLKGGAAAALYGSQAANGVILITTKKGTARQGIGVEVTSDISIGTPSIYPVYQYEYGQGNDGVKPPTAAAALSSGRLSYGAKIDGSTALQFDGVERPYTAVNVKENIKTFYRPSQVYTNTVAFNAGNQAVQMRLSLSDTRGKEQQPNSEYLKKTANMNVIGKMGRNDFITVEGSIQYNLVNGVNRPNLGYAELNAAWPVYLCANTVDVRYMAGQDPSRPGINVATGRELEWNPVPAAVNPYYLAYQIHNEDQNQRFIARGSIQVDLLPNLNIRGMISRDFNYYTAENYVPKTNMFTPLGYFNSDAEQRDKTNMQTMLNYHPSLLNGLLEFNIMVGANSERDFNKGSSADGSEWVIPDFYSLSNLAKRDLVSLSEGSSGTNSVFGEANIDYKDFIYLTVSGRNDWFSVLNPGYNSIFYPAVGGSLILSNIVKLPSLFDFVKLRSSWAQVGSATVSAGSSILTYTINTTNAYGLPTQSNPNSLFNPNIRPVTVTTVEGGFQIQMYDNRIGLDVNYYSRKTEDDILSPPISAATGYTPGRENMGLITNKGWEISLSGTPVRATNFSWDVNYNFSYNRSKIVELAEGIEYLSLGSGLGSGVTMINAVGLPYSTLRAYVIERTEDGTIVYNSKTGYESRVQKDLGVGNPPTLMGLSNTFTYKRFSLIVDIDSKFGGMAFSNHVQYAMRFGLTKNTLPGREEGLLVKGVDQDGEPYEKLWKVVDLDTYYNNLGTNYTGEFCIFKTDFIKLRRAVFRYNLPPDILRFIRVQSATIAITGQNLARLYMDKRLKEVGVDPEMQETTGNAQGSQGVSMPRTRNIGFNLSLKF